MTADGSLAAPFTDLKYALENPLLEAGDVIYLRAGTHVLTETVTVSVDNLLIRPYPGETAKIEIRGDLERQPQYSRLVINGDNVRFVNLEFAGKPTTRTATGQENEEYPDTLWIDVNGVVSPNGLFAGCILHDFITCTWFDDHAGVPDQVLYRDCIVYNYGFARSETVFEGEATYSQNAATAAGKSMINTILGPGFSLVTQIYGVNGVVHHWTFDHIVVLSTLAVGQRWYIHPGTPMSDIAIQDCINFGAGLWLGNSYGGNTNVDFVIDGCYLVKKDLRSQKIARWTSRQVTNSTFVLLSAGSEYPLLAYESMGLEGTSNWDYNAYYDGSPTAAPFRDQNATPYTFAQWRAATGFDAHSTLTDALPSTNVTWVYPCTTAPKVAHLIVANWESLDTVDVDVSSLGLTQGASYRLRQAYDPTVDVTDFQYDGSGVLTLAMTGRTVAIPEAWETALTELDQRFGAWSLEAL